MGQYLLDIVRDVALARFLGFWSVMGSFSISLLHQTPDGPRSQCTLCLHWN